MYAFGVFLIILDLALSYWHSHGSCIVCKIQLGLKRICIFNRTLSSGYRSIFVNFIDREAKAGRISKSK